MALSTPARRSDLAAVRPRAAPRMRRSFVTPEGVDLQLELGSAGTRAAAFMIDGMLIVVALVVVTILLFWLARSSGMQAAAIIWLIGFFVLRNGWFMLFEMGGRGATPGKRLMGLRVVARDGARLTGGAVIARNAMREIEVFLPLSFLAAQAAEGAADAFLTIFALGWSGIFLLFPLFNRDRLRVGDLVAGTWVVQAIGMRLARDVASPVERHRRQFSDAALLLYGEFELQTLEEVLRNGKDDAVGTVAAMIRDKAAIANDGHDREFLEDYYVALCVRLEGGALLGRRRADKHSVLQSADRRR